MKITKRDIDIITFIETYQGATIEQIQQLFFPSYATSKNRLKILSDNNYLRAAKHPILNKLVYFKDKLPSYHTIIINQVQILLKDRIIEFKREFKVGKFAVDGLMVLKGGKVVVVEVDIFNRTSEAKITKIKSILGQRLGVDIIILIINKYKREKRVSSLCVGMEEMEKIKQVI